MERLIVLIGIDRYRWPEQPLNASVTAVNAWETYFRSAPGGQATQVIALRDEDATVAHVTIVKEEATAEAEAAPSEPEVAKKGKADAAAAPAADAKKK